MVKMSSYITLYILKCFRINNFPAHACQGARDKLKRHPGFTAVTPGTGERLRQRGGKTETGVIIRMAEYDGDAVALRPACFQSEAAEGSPNALVLIARPYRQRRQ